MPETAAGTRPFCTSMRRTSSGAAERCVYPIGHACQHRHVLSDSPRFPRLPLPDEEMPSVQCVCGRRKQPGFICDFCYSTESSLVGITEERQP